MKTKKLLSTLLSAVMAVIVLASCGGAKNYSAEAAKAANAAQNTVVFETDTVLAKSLQNALKNHTQTSDVKAAMAADRDLKDLLTSGHQLDVFAMRADNAQAAAEAIAEKVAALVAGKMDEGKIAMVLADNGYYYAAVLTYRSVNNSNGGDNDEPPALPDVTGIVIATNEGGSVEIIEGQDVKTALQNMTVTIQYSDGTSETITNYEVSPSTFGEDELGTQKLTITFTGKNGQKVSVNVDVTVVAKQVKVQLHDAPCLVFRPSSVGGFHLLEERGHFVPGQRGGAEGHLVVEPSGRREPDGAGLPEGAEPDAGGQMEHGERMAGCRTGVSAGI